MIRRATAAEIPDNATDETLIRICSLKFAYGCEASFIQYYTDGLGGFLSLLDGVAMLFVPNLSDEWRIFLHMHPDILTLHCSETIAEDLLCDGWQGRTGVIMRYTGADCAAPDDICTMPYLPNVHSMLFKYFPGIASLDSWYPDVSHRVRHGCCHIGCVLRNNEVVSSAMTVAETPAEAIIGQVATATDFRRQGMAEKCIKSVISQCKGKSLYILPINENAARLYDKLGFKECGHWAELEREY